MRDQQLRITGSCPLKFLCTWITIAAVLFLLSESTSLKEKQLVFTGRTGKYVSLDGHQVRRLCMFTVCFDFNKTEESVATWAAFSYDVNSSSSDFRNVELALSINKSTLQVFILGNVTEMRQDFAAYKMHRICCVWDGKKKLFEIFHNGSKMKNITVEVTHQCLKPNGTLVLGQLHKNQNGHIIPNPSFVFIGILHYFQMWDYVRDQQNMANCDRGNAVSWQGDYWSLHGLQTESAHHQRCGEEKATSAAPPLPSKAPESTTTVTFYNIKTTFSVLSSSPNTYDYYDVVELSTNWMTKFAATLQN
ncbi:adhesion G-protein coupled receptor G4-like [Sceloporus undulatus]|uniref:adhesion G-protein coupled receptor G4-like n=1 Tax=Sceloporus undulatus TaxID=8520 RepID=UPI001C4CD4AF|nr:adhesion G-protein coupled receptor G4-like [Sceloporus undulatus]